MNHILVFVRRTIARLLIPTFNILPIASLGWLKIFVVRLHGASVDSNVGLSPRIFILNGFNLKIGEGANLGVDCRIIDICPINIGKSCLISHNVTFISGNHLKIRNYESIEGPICIGDNVWIGASVTIVGPCEIGENSIIGANSYVRGNIPANSIFAGSPAKLISKNL